MLTIKEISVTNFRSIRNECFALLPLTIFVGKNDVGKSNLLESIIVLLEGTATSVDTEDFYNPGVPITIEAVLAGVPEYLDLCDERNRPKLEQRLNADGLLTIRKVAPSPRKLGSVEVLDPGTRQFSTPTGIDAAIKPVLPEVIFIAALADVAEETKGTQKDTLGKLLSQAISGISDSVQPSLDEAYEQANRLLNVVQQPGAQEVDTRAADLIAIESNVTQYLQETFPRASVRLRVNLPSIRSILGQIDVLVKEGTNVDPYYRRGHGLQRALYLSLLRTLAERIRKQAQQRVSRPFLLLFEEPEAFLHPEGQVKMRIALSTISQMAQVVLATHSPVMVVPELVSKTARIEKRYEEPHPKPCTKRFGPIDERILTRAQRQLLPLFSLQRSSRFLFARGVLLVEGVGDEHLFSAIARRLRNFDLEANEVAIVEAGGKDKLFAFSEILRQLGLTTWMLTDIDFLWGGAGAVLGADPNLAALGDALKHRVPEIEDGSEAAQPPRKQRLKEACVGELAGQRDLVCDALLASGIFVLRHGEIEDYVGLGQNAKGQYLKAADEVRSGMKNVQHPEDFEHLLDALQRWAAE